MGCTKRVYNFIQRHVCEIALENPDVRKRKHAELTKTRKEDHRTN
jgi:hypothetical protein